MNIFSWAHRWLFGDDTPPPFEPTALPLAYRYGSCSSSEPHIHINCKWCRWTTTGGDALPPSAFTLVNEPCVGPFERSRPAKAEPPFTWWCITLSCPNCGRLISRFVDRGLVDRLLGAGMEIVDGMRTKVEEALKNVVATPPPYDRES